jgi:thiol-disulfide isomerase/thioredoxin
MAGEPRAADRLVWLVLAVAAAAVIAVAIGRGRSHRAATTQRAAQAISLPLLDGTGRASIAKGRVTVVDFWATWCAPCRISMPRVQSVWREYRARGVELFSVDTDEPDAKRGAQVKAFLRENALEFPVVLDDGSASSAFSVSVLPTMLVLDGAGQVVWQHIGAMNGAIEQDLRAALDSALSGAVVRSGG